MKSVIEGVGIRVCKEGGYLEKRGDKTVEERGVG